MLNRVLSILILLAILVSPSGCARERPDPAKPFQGTWDILSEDGKKTESYATIEKDTFQAVEIKKANGGTQLNADGGSAGVPRSVLQIDPANGNMDFVPIEGEQQGQTRPGIYKLEGNSLKICVANTNSPRPTDFTAGQNQTLYILERR